MVSHKEAGPPTFMGHVVVTTSQWVSIKKHTESPFTARLRLQWCGVFPRPPPRRPHSQTLVKQSLPWWQHLRSSSSSQDLDVWRLRF